MGLTDLSSRLLIEFRGDTSDLKGKLRELQGEEKKLAQAQLDHTEKRNQGLNQWGDKLAKTALILDGVEKVSNLLGDSIGKTAKSMLTAAANGATLGATFGGPVGAAIGGAIGALGSFITRADEQSAASLRAADAAKKHAAALQLIADGETSSREVRRKARETEEQAYEQFSAAQRKNVEIRSEASAADVERTRRVYREAQLERESLNHLDGEIWLEQQKRELGRVNAIKDIEAARRSGTIAADEADRRLKELNKTEIDSNDIVGQMRKRHEDTAEAVKKLNAALLAGTITGKEYTEALRAADEDYRKRDDERKKREEDAIRRAKALNAERAKLASKVAKDLTDDLVKQLESEGPSSILNGGAFSGIINPDKLSAQLDFRKAYADSEAAGKKKGPTLLERLGLNSPDEMDLALTAVQGFTSGLTTALQALGEGTLSAGDAFKKGLGIMVHAIGDKLAAMAAAEAIEGAAMLVTLNPMGALHLAAAGLLGAGAVAAYAASSKLGGGGGSAPATNAHASAGASGHYAGSTTTYLLGTNAGGGQTINQYIGSTDDDSPRMRQRRAQRFVALGSEHTSVGGSF